MAITAARRGPGVIATGCIVAAIPIEARRGA
jgi:hypothetical protein